jgi:hypothetical protein
MRVSLYAVMMFFLVHGMCCLCAPAEDFRVAILDDPSLPGSGPATPPQTFVDAVTNEGGIVSRLDAGQAGDASMLDPAKIDLFIVPTGASFPAAAKDALVGYLSGGGDLLCTGGYAFDQLWVKHDGQWRGCHEQWLLDKAKARDPQFAGIPNGGFENGAEGWETGFPNACAVVAREGCSGRACGQVSTPAATVGASWGHALAVEPGHGYLIGATAETSAIDGPGYAYLDVYQYDAQGNVAQFVDFAQFHQAAPWKRYEVQVDIAPKAARVDFRWGLHLASGAIWLDDVTCAPLPKEPIINAHYGKPEDGLLVEPAQLALFSPDQRFEGDTLAAAPGIRALSAWRSGGPVQGFEATAQLGGCARWMPLIEARDAFGRFSGAAGAFVHHYGGPFAKSTWALFGVTNRDIWTGPEGQALLQYVLSVFRTGAFLQELKTEAALYARGDTAHLSATVQNTSRYTRTVPVEFRLTGLSESAERPLLEESQTITLPPNSEQRVECAGFLPADAPDFVRVSAVLPNIDRADSGFVVRDAAIVAAGPRIQSQGNAFLLEQPGKSANNHGLFGTDTYAAMFSSPNQSPWTWYRDLQTMRNQGLHLFENLQFTPPDYNYTDKHWNQLEALIQLSQRFGLPYMAGLLVGQNVAVSDAGLQRQAEMCRQFAARFKTTPGLIYYLNGDFTLKLEDLPDLRRDWNAFLRERYASDDALRQAWAAAPPEAPLGDIPLKEVVSSHWYDPRTRDLTEFKTRLMRRWIETLCASVRAEDTAHPITCEFYQRPSNGVDLRLTTGSLDASNFGYFDAPQRDIARLMAVIKWNDLHFDGKMINIGEFGVKTHDAWAPERGGRDYHAQRTEEEAEGLYWWMAHAAMGMGVSKIQNWCWIDNPDRVFPWGLAWSNPLRPKPALNVYRNLSRLAESVAITPRPADVVFVMPDTWRLGAPEVAGYTYLMNALELLLATNVPFDVVNEAELARLREKPPRLVAMPFAYALSDDAITQLRALAESGASVYLSGDPSITLTGQRQPERLADLLGVRCDHESIAASGMPVPAVAPIDALAVENPCGLTIYRRPIGQGAIVWSPESWEAMIGHDLFVDEPALTSAPSANFYLQLLPMARLKLPAIEADHGVWRMTDTPSGENRLITLFPRAPFGESASVRLNESGLDIVFEMRRPVPAQILLNGNGEPLQATGTHALTVNHELLIRGEGAWMVMSRDKQPLRSSGDLLVSSTAAGKIWWRSEIAGISATVCIPHDGELSEWIAVPCRRVDDGWELDTQPNESYSLKASPTPPVL